MLTAGNPDPAWTLPLGCLRSRLLVVLVHQCSSTGLAQGGCDSSHHGDGRVGQSRGPPDYLLQGCRQSCTRRCNNMAAVPQKGQPQLGLGCRSASRNCDGNRWSRRRLCHRRTATAGAADAEDEEITAASEPATPGAAADTFVACAAEEPATAGAACPHLRHTTGVGPAHVVRRKADARAAPAAALRHRTHLTTAGTAGPGMRTGSC